MGVKTGPPMPPQVPPKRPKKKDRRYEDEYYKWKKYSVGCPWRNIEICCACTTVCNYTNCAPWHFLQTFRKNLIQKGVWTDD